LRCVVVYSLQAVLETALTEKPSAAEAVGVYRRRVAARTTARGGSRTSKRRYDRRAGSRSIRSSARLPRLVRGKAAETYVSASGLTLTVAAKAGGPASAQSTTIASPATTLPGGPDISTVGV